jgi:hypothetical protein
VPFETELDERGFTGAKPGVAVEEHGTGHGFFGAKVEFDLREVLERLADLVEEKEFSSQEL